MEGEEKHSISTFSDEEKGENKISLEIIKLLIPSSM